MDNLLLSGWWLTFNPSEQYEFVSWDDELSNMWKNNPVMFQSPPSSMDTLYIVMSYHWLVVSTHLKNIN